MLLLTYIVENKGSPQFRSFSVELFLNMDSGLNQLTVKPFYFRDGYHSNEYFIAKTGMKTIIVLAKAVMADHGQYDKIVNNCRHFSHRLFKSIEANTTLAKVPNFKPADIDRYYEKYPLFNGQYCDTNQYLSFSDLVERYPLAPHG